VRFDIVDNGHSERWIVAIDSGDIDVSRRSVAGDCTLRVPRKLFGQIAQGKANATAAVLRGDIETEGDWRLLVLVQRLFRRKEDGQS
jgi:putative sterol carrier protein